MGQMQLVYQGELRCEATHFSGSKLITDAPPDNYGKGESFSPTDLLCVSLASCMVTIMGIEAKRLEIPFDSVSAVIKKFMLANPRRVGKIRIELQMPVFLKNHPQRQTLEQAGLYCPVALSIHPNIEKDIEFLYE
ncbi:MAG: OsmC family protein [Flavobacteriales bacterium]|nr:OsmC family protein [Flavobacteriales bacterium]